MIRLLETEELSPPAVVSPQVTTDPSALNAAKALSVDTIVVTVLSVTPAVIVLAGAASTVIPVTDLKKIVLVAVPPLEPVISCGLLNAFPSLSVPLI